MLPHCSLVPATGLASALLPGHRHFEAAAEAPLICRRSTTRFSLAALTPQTAAVLPPFRKKKKLTATAGLKHICGFIKARPRRRSCAPISCAFRALRFAEASSLVNDIRAT